MIHSFLNDMILYHPLIIVYHRDNLYIFNTKTRMSIMHVIRIVFSEYRFSFYLLGIVYAQIKNICAKINCSSVGFSIC